MHFLTSFLGERSDLEMGTRDVLATITDLKVDDINGFGLTSTTCRRYLQSASVVMLSIHMPNSSIRQFMKSISTVHDVDSILLQCCPWNLQHSTHKSVIAAWDAMYSGMQGMMIGESRWSDLSVLKITKPEKSSWLQMPWKISWLRKRDYGSDKDTVVPS